MRKLIDLTGKRFERLVVVKRAPSRVKLNGGTMTMWECKCDCGKTVIVWAENLKSKKQKSCGCLKDENTSKRNHRHGHRYTRLYAVWLTMRSRCKFASQDGYPRYGGRGISVCDEWDNSFMAFYKWATANGYDENALRGRCTLDRIDNDGNYEPDNCRWVDMKVQSNNKSKKGRLNANICG